MFLLNRVPNRTIPGSLISSPRCLRSSHKLEDLNRGKVGVLFYKMRHTQGENREELKR